MALLAIFICNNFLSQGVQFEVPYQELTEKYGLNSREVYKVEKDSKGNVWICSDGGVNMFDGTGFHSFTIENGLVDNVVFDIYEDYKGRVWFLSYNSKLCYYENGNIIEFAFNDEIVNFYKGLSQNQKKLVIDSSNNLYYAVHNAGLIKISPDGVFMQLQDEIQEIHIEILEKEPIIYNRASFDIIDGKQPNKLVSTWLVKNNLKTKVFKSLVSSRFCVIQCENDEIYFSIKNEIILATNGKSILKVERLIEFGEYDSEHFWVGTTNGLLIVSKENGEIRRRILNGISISSVLKINQNSFWIGTLDQGALYVPNIDLMLLTKENGLIQNDIVDICGLSNELFVSFGNCIQDLSRRTSFQLDLNKTIFLGATDSTLVVGDFEKNVNVKVDDRSLFVGGILDSYRSRNDVFWTTGGSIHSFNEKTKKITCWYSRSADSLENKLRFTSVFYDIKKGLIAGNRFGLFLIENGKYFKLDKLNITDLKKGYDESILISTANQGVRFLHNTYSQIINKSIGLVSNKVFCLENYRDSIFFFGTNKGVNWYNARNHKLGLIKLPRDIRSNSLEIFHDSIFVGTKRGLFKLSVHDLELDYDEDFLLSINDFNIDNESISFDTDNVIIPFGTRVMRVNIACLDFESFDNFKMQFRFNSEDQWTDINDLSVLILNPKDNFDFEARYLKGDGKWSYSKKLFSVEIELPFYKRIEFFILLFITVLAVLFYSRKYFLSKKRKKAEVKQKLFQLEQQIQQTKMNPHFLFNILNSIHSQIVFEEYNSAEAYLMTFSKFLRRLISRTTVDSITIREEVEFLNKYVELQKIGTETKFEFAINMDSSLNLISMPAMMLQPLVENSINYGIGSLENDSSHGKVELTISKLNESTLKVILTDNGIAELESKISEGHAIDITKKRLSFYNELMNCNEYSFKIYKEKKLSPLTRVELLVPIIIK